MYCCGINGNFICFGSQKDIYIFYRFDFIVDSEGDIQVFCDIVGQCCQGFVFFVCGGDIQEDQFVGFLFVVEGVQFYGVICIVQVDKIDIFYGVFVFDIQVRYDVFGQYLKMLFFVKVGKLCCLYIQGLYV